MPLSVLNGTVIARVRNGWLSRNSSTDRKSTRLNSSHSQISYAVFCLKKKNIATADEARLHHAFRHYLRRHPSVPARTYRPLVITTNRNYATPPNYIERKSIGTPHDAQ